MERKLENIYGEVMIVYSHRRSGTHLLMTYLDEVFKISSEKQHYPFPEKPTREIIYIVRNPMDVLTSCFHWWKRSGESKVSGIAKSFKNITIEQYLKGFDPVSYDKKSGEKAGLLESEVRRGIFNSPIDFWNRHATYGIASFGFVTYETLVTNPHKAIEYISYKYRIAPQNPISRIDRFVGHHPRKGIIGDHKNLFTPVCYDLIEEKAGILMKKLGYEVNNA